MPPAASQRNVILEYLVDTLLPSIVAGSDYNLSVRTKERGLKDIENIPETAFPAVFVGSADEARKNTSSRHFQSTLTVFLYGVVKADGSGKIQEQMDLLIADLTKAFYAGSTPGGDDPMHGSIVTRTEIKGIQTDDAVSQTHGKFMMTVEMDYTKRGNVP